MASIRAVGTALKLMSRAFAGVVDEAKVEVYAAALDDVPDEDIASATTILIKTHPGEFIPTPAQIRNAVGANAKPTVDAASVIRQIEKMAQYNPAVGMIYPHVATVAQAMGEATAYAYAAAGGPRIFSDNEISRDIAEREFQKAFTEAVSRPAASLDIIGMPATKLIGRAMDLDTPPTRT